MADPKLPWDQKLANDAAVAEQCVKLGGVVLTPPKQKTGFQGTEPYKHNFEK